METIKHELTAKCELFCLEYCLDWNATRAAIKAGYSKKTARSQANRLLTIVDIKKRIRELRANLAETAGISALKVLKEHEKIAFSNIGDLREGWINLKQFEDLTPEQKACIQEVSSKTEKKTINGIVIDEESVRIKLYDKQKALDAISKMLGFNEPEKIDIELKGSIPISDWIKSKSK